MVSSRFQWPNCLTNFFKQSKINFIHQKTSRRTQKEKITPKTEYSILFPSSILKLTSITHKPSNFPSITSQNKFEPTNKRQQKPTKRKKKGLCIIHTKTWTLMPFFSIKFSYYCWFHFLLFIPFTSITQQFSTLVTPIRTPAASLLELPSRSSRPMGISTSGDRPGGFPMAGWSLISWVCLFII